MSAQMAFAWKAAGVSPWRPDWGGTSAPTGVGSSWLASAAAVNMSNAQIAAAGIRCRFRLQATAAKLGAAASSYSANEAESAGELRALNKPAVS
jgi:hypothetical protein